MSENKDQNIYPEDIQDDQEDPTALMAQSDQAKLHLFRQMRDRPCQSKSELQEWLRTYLSMDFPDYTLDPESNCNPMEMVWTLYKNMVHWNKMKPDRRATKFLFYATRGGFKTLAAAVVELLALIHDNRGTAHIAAGESHVKHCYNDYFQPLIKLPIIKEKIKSTIMEKTVLAEDEKVSVEIMPCTRKRVQGPHQSLVCKDEIDVVQDISAYADIDGIPVNMPDGRPPITFGISVRKCVTENTYVLSDGALKSVRDLVVGDVIDCGGGESRKVVANWESGHQECLRIETSMGSLETSLLHKHAVWDCGLRLKKTEDLKLGDLLLANADRDVSCKFNVNQADLPPEVALSHYVPVSIDKIENIGIQKTYNIEVDQDHMYLANNILTANSSFGLVQREIDEAPSKGVKVFHWNLIDITERCLPSRHGKHKIPIYIKRNTLVAIGQQEYDRLDSTSHKDYELHEGWDGCLKNCKLFAACRGLLPFQMATSKWLKPIDYTQEKFFSSKDEGMAIAQFLCSKPPATGLIYPDYSPERNEKTFSEMWEIFFKQKPPKEITKEEMVAEFHKHKIPCYFGVDWGFDPDPTVVLAIFIDSYGRHYVVEEFVCWRTSEAEVAFWLSDENNKENWQRVYRPELVYPDLSHPGGRKELEKVGFMCAGPKRTKTKMQRQGQKDNVIKDVKPGISSMRGLIRIPGSTDSKLFINREKCPTLCFELSRYHNKTDESGNVVSDTPATNQPDHTCDAIRYVVHSQASQNAFSVGLDVNYKIGFSGVMTRAPTPEEAGAMMGIPIVDNSDILRVDTVDDDDDGGFDGGGGFNFSF